MNEVIKEFRKNFPAFSPSLEEVLPKIEKFLLTKLKERDDKLSAIRGVLDSEIDDWNKLIFIKDLIK